MNITAEIIYCPHCGKLATIYYGHVRGLNINGSHDIGVIYGTCDEHFKLPSPLSKWTIYSKDEGYKGQWHEKLGLRITTITYTVSGQIVNSLEHIGQKEK